MALLGKSLVYVSPLLLTEQRIKTMVGKLPEFTISKEILKTAGIEIMPYGMDHAERFGDFHSLARHDPFDRMLLAQALAEDLVFLTADKLLLSMDLKNVVGAAE